MNQKVAVLFTIVEVLVVEIGLVVIVVSTTVIILIKLVLKVF